MGDFTALGSLTGISSEGTSTGTRGTVITGSASTNTKSSWVELDASTATDSSGLIVYVRQAASSTLGSGMMVDIGIGAASSEEVLVESLKINLGVIMDIHPNKLFNSFCRHSRPAARQTRPFS